MSLRYTLLALLSEGPNTGYGIGRLLEQRLSYLWGARVQQIYRELSKLEVENFVAVDYVAMLNRPAKKIYTITPAGGKALDQWLEEPPVPLLGKSELLVKFFCMERLPNDFIIARLEERQVDFEGMAQSLRGKLIDARRTPPGQLGYLLTLEASLSAVEGQASWCAATAAELREAEPAGDGAQA